MDWIENLLKEFLDASSLKQYENDEKVVLKELLFRIDGLSFFMVP